MGKASRRNRQKNPKAFKKSQQNAKKNQYLGSASNNRRGKGAVICAVVSARKMGATTTHIHHLLLPRCLKP